MVNSNLTPTEKAALNGYDGRKPPAGKRKENRPVISPLVQAKKERQRASREKGPRVRMATCREGKRSSDAQRKRGAQVTGDLAGKWGEGTGLAFSPALCRWLSAPLLPM